MSRPAEAKPDGPRVLTVDIALGSSDPATRTMAKMLDLLTLLVPASIAVFYAVDGCLDKYAAEPIVAKTVHRPVLELDHAARVYRERYARDDPFSPRHLAGRDVRVATARDIGRHDWWARSWYARELSVSLAAELYLRAAGRIVAGISLMREPGHPDLSRSEIAVLRKSHAAFEDVYALACQQSPRSGFEPPGGLELLTTRERDVLQLLVDGATNREIGGVLQISQETVKTHVKNVFAKLEVTSRREITLRFPTAEDQRMVRG